MKMYPPDLYMLISSSQFEAYINNNFQIIQNFISNQSIYIHNNALT